MHDNLAPTAQILIVSSPSTAAGRECLLLRPWSPAMNATQDVEDGDITPARHAPDAEAGPATGVVTPAPPSHPQADDDNDGDHDSTYGDDSLLRDDTKTLTSYMTEYRYEYGRRYHAFRDGAYWVCGGLILNSVHSPALTSAGPQ